MNKDELRKLVKEASNRVDILAGFLPSVGTKKRKRYVTKRYIHLRT